MRLEDRLGAAGKHHAGQRPTRKRNCALAHAGREDDGIGLQDFGAIFNLHMDLAVAEGGVRDRVGAIVNRVKNLIEASQQPFLARELGWLSEFGSRQPGIGLAIDLTARSCRFIQDGDFTAARGRFDGSGHAGGSRTDDDYGSAHGRRPCCRQTIMPGRASVTHARVSGTPSMLHRHSQHTPIPQTAPLALPASSIRRQRSPASSKAAATLCPTAAVIGLPSKLNSNLVDMFDLGAIADTIQRGVFSWKDRAFLTAISTA